jgi:hypothetical protein
VGQVLYRGTVGQVVASRTLAFAGGDIVLPNNGWAGWAAIRSPRRCSGSLARTPPAPPAHDGFRRPTISTQLDWDDEAVGGTLALRPDEGLVVELA